MTTIAACRVGSTYAIAADRQWTANDEPRFSATSKLRQVAPWLVLGMAGPACLGSWLRSLTVDEAPASLDEAVTILDRLGDDLRAWSKDHDIDGAACLGVTPWGICMLHTRGDATLYTDVLHAIGSGAGYAIGAMHVMIHLADQIRTVEHIAERAVTIAARHDNGTGGPVDVLTIEAAP